MRYLNLTALILTTSFGCTPETEILTTTETVVVPGDPTIMTVTETNEVVVEVPVLPADADNDGFNELVDCNDADATVHPGAMEVCDGLDNNCDWEADEPTSQQTGTLNNGYRLIMFPDNDGDMYGVHAGALYFCDVVGLSGYAPGNSDCNDFDPNIHPDADEVCDGGIDNDCDGLTETGDDSLVDGRTWYIDSDGDGYGSMVDTPVFSCEPPLGYSYAPFQDDCNDSDASIHPGAVDIEDGIDADCDGATECENVHYGWPNDGKVTTTMVSARLVSPIWINTTPGGTVEVAVEFTNTQCDWADVDFMVWSVSAWGNSPWIEQMEDDYLSMEMEVSLNNQEYAEVGFNVLLDGEQLFYNFDDMDTLWLAPGASVLTTFRFTGMYALQSGDEFVINLSSYMWNDFATGTRLHVTPADDVTVTIL